MREKTKRISWMDKIQWKSNEHKNLIHRLFWAEQWAEYASVFAEDREADEEFYREASRICWRLAMDICEREGYPTNFLTPDLETEDD